MSGVVTAEIAEVVRPMAAIGRAAAGEPGWVTPAQLHPARIYEALRARCIADFVALRARRRLRVTPALSVLFEGRETVLLQIYEVLRAEGWDPARAEREIAGYACLVPGPGRLCATAMIDGGDPALGRRLVRALGGRGGLRLCCGPLAAASERAEEGGDDGPVHYLRFPIDARLGAAILAGRPLALVVDAAEPSIEVDLPAALRGELARDLDPTPTATPLLRAPA